MMLLLDTCTFLYYLDGSKKLSEKAINAIESDTPLYLSQTTLWEIAIKKTIKKLNITESILILRSLRAAKYEI